MNFTQKLEFYLASVTFDSKMLNITDSFFLLFLLLFFSCSLDDKNRQYSQLTDYEGRYEYLGDSSLDLVASDFDTTLYAILDQAKYPLTHITEDSFLNVRKQAVVFQRNDNNEVISYTSGGQKFNLLNRNIEKPEMFPRKEMFNQADEYSYEEPKIMDDGLLTGSLEEEFTRPGLITEMIQKTIQGNFPEVHSILIYKNEQLILEEYFYGYNATTPHQLRSANKPLIGALVGIAIEKGFIEDEQKKLLPFFKHEYENIAHLDSRKKKITIENFLNYRHGLDCENNNPESDGNEMKMMNSEDWVKYTLDLPMVAEPGNYSSYCTGCAHTLGRLVELTTGEKLEQFAQQQFFHPMGITNYSWTFESEPNEEETFHQMFLTPRDLVKIAKMYKDGGRWKGKQILTEDWVNKTLTMDEGDYGYLWEHKYVDVDGKRYNSYLASGNGGQKINIWPELDMITVFTGGNYNSYELYGKSTPPNEMIPNYILKAL